MPADPNEIGESCDLEMIDIELLCHSVSAHADMGRKEQTTMETHQVTCIIKNDDSNTGIVSIGSGSHRWTTANAIREIKSGATSFYTMAGGVRAAVVVEGTPPNEYLTTDPDQTTKNNLLSLPTCT